MSAYEYTALDSEGNTHKGIIESDGERQARQQLRDKKWIPLKVKTATLHRFSLASEKSLHIPRLQLVLITRQLATLISAGMPIDVSIKATAEQNSDKNSVKLLLELRARIMEGHSLAQALKEYPSVFPALYVATVAAGEKSGHLGTILEKLADYVEVTYQNRQKVLLALLYPAILLTVSVLIVAGLLSYVVPKIVAVFTGTGQPLPLLTRELIALSNFLGSYGIVLLLLLIACFFAVKTALKKQPWRARADRTKLKLPLFGELLAGLDTARFLSTLSILSSSGIKLVEGLRIANATVENGHIRSRIGSAIQTVEAGSSLRAALTETGCFQPLVVHMIGSGETSGSLDDMLKRAADNQRNAMDNRITVMVRLFEPLMLVVMGMIVMLIVLAILLPILNLNRLVL
ncbi:MAG TPA: type II secretion system inner membrane protein GspF [Candidatus Acidoferrum sp.]|nr:type II secretion system inner membrane protein GspF [Candidatus Acidoferrum sp.]